MAKTIWVDGSILTPTFMDTFFGNSAITGHRHTGTNDDGSAPLIEPATEFQSTGPNILIPNVNLEIKTTFLMEATFDNSATFPQQNISCTLQRVGNQVVFHIGTTIVGTMGVTDNVLLRRQDLTNFPSDYFGSTFTLSTAFGVEQDGFWYSCHIDTGLGSGGNSFLLYIHNASTSGAWPSGTQARINANTSCTWYKDV